MSAPGSIPPDQSAVLSLILKQGKSYKEIADLLGLSTATVRVRAAMAVDTLMEGVSGPTEDQKNQIVDYLLGQTVADSSQVTEMFVQSERALLWAAGLIDRLREFAPAGWLPELPGTSMQTEPAKTERKIFPTQPEKAATSAATGQVPATSSGSPVDRATVSRSSRTGGAVLLAVTVALVVAAVIAIVKSEDKGADKPNTKTTNSQNNTGSPKIERQVNLLPANSRSKALGVAQIVRTDNRLGLALIGENLNPSGSRFAYAVWLYNSSGDAKRLGYTPPVTSNGRLQGLARLPANTSSYKQLIVTKETTANPKKPGQIVLRGRLDL